MIELDGSYGEGGGQILRAALGLSAVLGQPFRITNIRRKRKRPGLLPQHLTGVRAAARICRARTVGAEFDSTELVFEPGGIRGGEYAFDVAEERGSAGSVTLVAQSVLPLLLFAGAESRVTIRGGTHVPFSPCHDYLAEVLVPFLRLVGFELETEIVRYGFFPVGRGEIVLRTRPARRETLRGIELVARPALSARRLVSAVARLPRSIAERQADRFTALCQGEKPEVEIREVSAQSPGTYVFYACRYGDVVAGFSALGALGKPAEKVAEEAFGGFEAFQKTDACVEPHLADQILVFLVLAGRPFSYSTSMVTAHLLTNVWVVQQFLPEVRLTVSEPAGAPGVVCGQADLSVLGGGV